VGESKSVEQKEKLYGFFKKNLSNDFERKRQRGKRSRKRKQA